MKEGGNFDDQPYGGEVGSDAMNMQEGGEWVYGHFSCYKDIPNCLCTCCFPQCMYGSAVSKSYGPWQMADCCFFACCGFQAGTYSLMREGYHIQGDTLTDCLYFLCCANFLFPCCQMVNEVDARGVRPFSHHARNLHTSDWETGFCEFFEDIPGCLISTILPQVGVGMLGSEYADFHFCYGCCCVAMPILRYDMRHEYNIEGNCCGDLCLSMIFPGCTYVQMKKEVESKGNPFTSTPVSGAIQAGPTTEQVPSDFLVEGDDSKLFE
eukprot:CAMPEP_0201475186 /NCGR_PEP_ID=MMETSP0151_2-20130828/630_1 /ASSEMBLY_ACC=CAM_ASM_000257 /TAXON_ID=200890 /ORGANISM="Paramoeba atlantica, Strain 621/1 / CCAP 1560/9" /LENGTH=265 /DNA_ID=CAMNT_0047855205 /DNA_START=101 /DNA_END=898 /DNA_ORIENTATION=+